MEPVISETVVVKRKKGRPKKTILDVETQNNNPEQVVEKKKRGRKKKIVLEEEVKPKKKRGRKAAIKFFSSSIRKKIPLTTVLQDNNNYILHIPTVDETNENDNNLTFDSLEECQNDVSLITSILPNITISDNILKETNIVKTTNNLNDNILDDNIKELYEKRIQNRETQDQILFEKLDKLHKDDNFFSNLVINEMDNNNNNNSNNLDNQKMNTDQSNNRKKGFFSMMYDFVNNTEWLEKTNVCCWWCCHAFENVPLGMPMEYVNTVNKFRVKGIYCSFACMKADHDSQKMSKHYLIRFLYDKLTGNINNDINIQSAPPRCTLKMFGGDLTIDEFRRSTEESKIYKMINYPMFISKDYVEEVDLEHIKNVNMKVFRDVKSNKIVNNNSDKIAEAKLRLSEIEKSTISFGNTIDKFIKIS